MSGRPSFDPYARGASTTEGYYSVPSGQMTSDMEYRTVTGGTEYHTTTYSNSKTKPPSALFFGDNPSRPMAPSTQKKTTWKRSLNLEPILAAKETENTPTKYLATCDVIIDDWMVLMKRYLKKAHAKDTPKARAWALVDSLENEGKDYITNKSEAERDTDDTNAPIRNVGRAA